MDSDCNITLPLFLQISTLVFSCFVSDLFVVDACTQPFAWVQLRFLQTEVHCDRRLVCRDQVFLNGFCRLFHSIWSIRTSLCSGKHFSTLSDKYWFVETWDQTYIPTEGCKYIGLSAEPEVCICRRDPHQTPIRKPYMLYYLSRSKTGGAPGTGQVMIAKEEEEEELIVLYTTISSVLILMWRD